MEIIHLIAEVNTKINAGSVNVPSASSTDVFAGVLYAIYWGAGATAVITIMIASFIYTISGGNPGEVEKAKGALTYAVIGLIVVIIAFGITQFILGRF